METIERKQTAFRLRKDLLSRIQLEAKKANKSVNNYVETILYDAIYREPNKETLDAMEEVRSGKYAGVIDTSSMEAFIKSCE